LSAFACVADYSMNNVTEITESLLSSYATALAEELVNEISKSANPNQELLVNVDLDDGSIVLVGYGRDIAQKLLKAFKATEV
jgi:hypothetical protein